jgi:general secretion pathway protein N
MRFSYKEIDFNYKKEQGFDQVDGGIQWAGGELMYIFAQRPQQMQIPSLAGRLSQEQNKLMVDLRDQRQQKLMNLTIDPSLMLDVQLTQRLMLNVPSYQGKAGLDSYVVSSRQPLLSGGF